MNSLFCDDITYTRNRDLLADSRNIIETASAVAYNAVNVALGQRNCLQGFMQRISNGRTVPDMIN